MASDRQRFRRALKKWELFCQEGYVSCPPGLGRTALICSYGMASSNPLLGPGRLAILEKERRAFRKETFALADMIRKEGGEPEVVLNARSTDMHEVLTDPYVTDIYVIGHGNVGSAELGDQTYSWEDVSTHSDHVKLGSFVQRHCGLWSDDLNVPLGLFAVYDPRKVIAPLDNIFEPSGLQHPDNELLKPVFDTDRISYKFIKQNLPHIS